MDIFGLLCIGAVVLLALAAVGHGLWLGIAWFFRVVSGENSKAAGASTFRPHCATCGRAVEHGDICCTGCGSLLLEMVGPPGLPHARSAAALRALSRQIEQLQQSGLITQAAYESMRETLRNEQGRLEKTTAAQPAMAPLLPRIEAASVREPPSVAPPPVQPSPVQPSPRPTTPVERVQAYVARQAETPAEAEVVAEPAPPRRPFSELLAAFMEERHLRWGELVGGLLIVCGSIALVLSFWVQISQSLFLQFFVFNGVTAGLFGLGVYADRRIKLPTTSQGLLVIATMLVPLNFLALAAFSLHAPPTDVVAIGGEVLSFALFAWLTFVAGRTITELREVRGAWLLAIGVIGPSVATLLIRRFIVPEPGGGLLFTLAIMPFVFYVGVNACLLWQARRWATLDEHDANAILRLLGLTTFAVLLPLGLLAEQSKEPAVTLQRLAPLVSLAAAPMLATGLLFWRRLLDPAMTGMRVVGTSIAAVGTLVLMGGIVLAWPQPSSLVPVAAANFLVLTTVALLFEIPAAHLLAAPCLTLAYLLVFHVLQGNIAWHVDQPGRTARALLSATSGTALVPMTLVFAAAAIFWRARRRLDAQFYLILAGASAAVSLGLVTWYGFGRVGDPGGATWVYALYAIGALSAAAWLRERYVGWAGSALLLAALVQGLVFRFAQPWGLHQPWLLAVLSHSTAMIVFAAAISLRRRDSNTSDEKATFHDAATDLATTALVTSIGASLLLVVAVGVESSAFVAGHALWLSVTWCALAWMFGSAALFSAFQAALAFTVAFAVVSGIERTAWSESLTYLWIDPWTLQLQGIALSLIGILWTIVRLFLRQRNVGSFAPTSTRLLFPPWPSVDRIITWLLLVLLLGLSLYAALPGAAQELSPRRLVARLESPLIPSAEVTTRQVPSDAHFELPGLPHEHAVGAGSWLFLAALAALFVIAQWERVSIANMAGVLVALSMTCPLIAARWESDVGVASALRWSSAIFLAFASAAIWFRRPLSAIATRIGWRDVDRLPRHALRDMTTLVLTLAVVPLVAMGAFVAITAVADHPIGPGVSSTFQFLAWVFLFASVAAGVLFAVSAGWVQARQLAWARHASTLIFILGVAPLVALAIFVVSSALRGNPIVGPEPGSFFHRIGLAISYALPLTLLALTLVGFAIRERSARFAFAAGLLFNLSATAAYLMAPRASGLQLDEVLWVKLGQLNAMVSAVFSLAWMAADVLFRRRLAEPMSSLRAPGLLITQALLGVALHALVLVPAAGALFIEPQPAAVHMELARPLGWCSWLLVVASMAGLGRMAAFRFGPGTWCAALWSLGAMVTFTLCAYDRGGWHWLGYHGLMLSHAACGVLLLGGVWAVGRIGGQSLPYGRRGVTLWTTVSGGLTVLLALREVVDYPQPWWAVSVLVAMSVLAAALTCYLPARAFLYVAGALINVAAMIAWFHVSNVRGFGDALLQFIEVNVIAISLPAIAWVLLEILVVRRKEEEQPTRSVGFHRVAAAVAVVGMVALVAVGLAADAAGESIQHIDWLGWAALAAAMIAATACLWDDRAKLPVAGLYVLGLVGVGMILDHFDLPARMIGWTGTMILAAYAIGTSYLWSRRGGLLDIADRLRIPRDMDRPYAGLAWLVPANGLLTAVVLISAYLIALTFDEASLRLSTGMAAVLQTVAIALLARGERRSPLQYAALCVGVIGALAWAWAWLDPATPGELINRTVVAAVVLGVMTSLYGLGLGKLLPGETEWTKAAGRLVPGLAALGLAAILLVLGIEAYFALNDLPIPISYPAIAAVAATLVGLCVAALVAAVVPGRDPLGLSERGRTIYVYVAEAMLALLFLHIRLSMPWLFRGFFTKYWPFIVVFIAFIGVGLSELFRRQRRDVLAEPLERTGALLPILPVLGFWLTPAQGHYSVLLLMVGVLYAALSVTRRSFGFGLLAALAANGGLWYYLQNVEGYGLLEHPQVWLIPIALCVLAAAYLNREQLTVQQMATIRYLASITIYVSSTADIFLIGVANNPWLPLVLAGFSIAGIFLGIMLRVRAFLFLGTAFLLLSLFTIIWYAAVDREQTWLWYLSAIVAGIVIIAVFALFEKKRNDVLRVIEEVKKWDA
jgi:hypothetical protein